MPGRVTVAGIQKDPLLYGVYSMSLSVIAGTVAANNFMTLFNPAGSGKFVALGGIFFSSYGMGTTTAVEPARGFRISTATGGTVANVSEIAKYDTTYPNPTGEIRYNNPAVTLGAQFLNSPPPLGTGGIGTQFVDKIEPPPTAGGFILRPGEGAVLRTNAGDIDQLWNLSIVWGEGPGG